MVTWTPHITVTIWISHRLHNQIILSSTQIYAKNIQVYILCNYRIAQPQLLGRLQAAIRAVPLTPLFYHKLQQGLQRALTRVLRPRLFSPANPLQRGAGGITLWLDHLSAWNSRTITTQNIITEWLNPHSLHHISKSLPLPTQWVPAILDTSKVLPLPTLIVTKQSLIWD